MAKRIVGIKVIGSGDAFFVVKKVAINRNIREL